MLNPSVAFMPVYIAGVLYLHSLDPAFKATMGGKFTLPNAWRQLLIVCHECWDGDEPPFNSALNHMVGDDALMLSALSGFQQFLSNKPASKPSGPE